MPDTYQTNEVAKMFDLTFRRIDYCCRTGILRPKVPAKGSGSNRGFSYDDVMALCLLAQLTEIGLTPKAAEPALDALRTSEHEWKGLLLIDATGSKIENVKEAMEMVDWRSRGAFIVISIVGLRDNADAAIERVRPQRSGEAGVKGGGKPPKEERMRSESVDTPAPVLVVEWEEPNEKPDTVILEPDESNKSPAIALEVPRHIVEGPPRERKHKAPSVAGVGRLGHTSGLVEKQADLEAPPEREIQRLTSAKIGPMLGAPDRKGLARHHSTEIAAIDGEFEWSCLCGDNGLSPTRFEANAHATAHRLTAPR